MTRKKLPGLWAEVGVDGKICVLMVGEGEREERLPPIDPAEDLIAASELPGVTIAGITSFPGPGRKRVTVIESLRGRAVKSGALISNAKRGRNRTERCGCSSS